MYIWIKGNQNWWKRKFYFTRKKNHKNQTIFLTKIIIENIENHLEYMYIALFCNFIMRALLCLLSFKSPYTYFKLSATPIVLGTFSYYWMNEHRLSREELIKIKSFKKMCCINILGQSIIVNSRTFPEN